MIVLDASIVINLLTNDALAPVIERALASHAESFIAPHLIDIEVMSALRNLVYSQRVDSHRAGRLLEELAALPVERYPHTPLLGRIWELRHNFTAYDAAYIALAEATNSVLYTSDHKLGKGHQAKVVVLSF